MWQIDILKVTVEVGSKKKPLEAEPDENSDPLSASTPKEAMALAIKFLEGLKPPEPKEEPEEEVK